MSATGPGSSASALNGPEQHGDARLLISDIRVALLLLRQARHAVVVRLFGVDQDDSLLISIIALAALARAARDLTSGVVVTPGRPSVGDSMIGASVLRESAHWLSGDRYRDTPVFGTLIAFAFFAAAVGPVVRGSARGVKNASHRARFGLDQRYGHLIRTRGAGGR